MLKNGRTMHKIIYKHAITFEISPTEKIIIQLDLSLDRLDCCYIVDILLSQFNQEYTLSNEPVRCAMEDLTKFLKQALNNELQLHESITQNIGYLCNEYWQEKEGFVIDHLTNETSIWVGYRYRLWEGNNNNVSTNSWIYNDNNGAIILEITPSYPYTFCEPAEEPDYIPYDEWIKTYKPYLIKTLSIETAQKWLEQSKYITKVIQTNVARWEKSLAENNEILS